jgi:hypothetical protein
MSETKLSRDIRKAIEAYGYKVLRLPAGRWNVKGGAVLHVGEPGMPDLFIPELNLWLEVKAPGGRLEKTQKEWFEWAKDHGVNATMVRSVEEALLHVKIEKVYVDRRRSR